MDLGPEMPMMVSYIVSKLVKMLPMLLMTKINVNHVLDTFMMIPKELKDVPLMLPMDLSNILMMNMIHLVMMFLTIN